MVVFLNLRLCVENIFDENTKYCRFLINACVACLSILNTLCTKADDDDDVF
jgi:hypothetical protein